MMNLGHAVRAGRFMRHGTAIQAPMLGPPQALARVCLNQPSFGLATKPTCSTACREPAKLLNAFTSLATRSVMVSASMRSRSASSSACRAAWSPALLALTHLHEYAPAAFTQFGAQGVFVIAGEPRHDLLEMHRQIQRRLVDRPSVRNGPSTHPFKIAAA